ncbi:unnamed protein product [Ilex paraguariensis]|uniref:Uncharacterized protein n=1 Tax=Ilex paraguariensis TaxID=185542 RepID=A0ABC8R136_9AQUA
MYNLKSVYIYVANHESVEVFGSHRSRSELVHVLTLYVGLNSKSTLTVLSLSSLLNGSIVTTRRAAAAAAGTFHRRMFSIMKNATKALLSIVLIIFMYSTLLPDSQDGRYVEAMRLVVVVVVDLKIGSGCELKMVLGFVN